MQLKAPEQTSKVSGPWVAIASSAVVSNVKNVNFHYLFLSLLALTF